MLNSKISEKENEIIVLVNPLLYPIEAIYGASYVFLDRVYLFLDGDPKKSVAVRLRGKEKMTSKQLKDMAGEFYNEILNYTLRDKISKNNQKLREYIMARTLFTAPQSKIAPQRESPTPKDWQEDKLGLALPWDQRYGAKNKKRAGDNH